MRSRTRTLGLGLGLWICAGAFLGSGGLRAEVASRGSYLGSAMRSEESRRLLEEGFLFLYSSRFERARPIFEALVARESRSPIALVGLGWSQPRFKEMYELVNRAVDLLAEADVEDGEELFVRGFAATINGDRATFVANMARIADLYPENAQAHFHYGNALLFGRDDPAAALLPLRKSVALEGNFASAFNTLGQCYRRLGRLAEAKETFERYAALAPDDPAAFNALGAVALREGDLARARERYAQAIELEPFYDASHLGLSTAMMLDGRHEQARQHLIDLYPQVPNDGIRSGIHFALAVIHSDEGRLDEALQELDRNYRLSEEIGDTVAMTIDLGNRSRILREQGRFDEAIEVERKRLEIVRNSDEDEQRKTNREILHLYHEGIYAASTGSLDRAAGFAEELSRRAEESEDVYLVQTAHELHALLALEREAWPTAIEEFLLSDSGDAYNMYLMAVAFARQGDVTKAREMAQYVVEYRGVMNLHYALARRKAESLLASLESTPSL